MAEIDLTPFGFTPTESRVYEVLLRTGPGTGYTIAREAGLARANTYGALEGLVSKGAATLVSERPRRYRPEPPQVLVARITNRQGTALDELTSRLAAFEVPPSDSLVAIETPRAALQLMSRDISRARQSVDLLAPADAYPILAPALRRAVSLALRTRFLCPAPVELPFAPVELVDAGAWPGEPILLVTDDNTALLGARQGGEVQGHWSTSPVLVAAARWSMTSWPKR